MPIVNLDYINSVNDFNKLYSSSISISSGLEHLFKHFCSR